MLNSKDPRPRAVARFLTTFAVGVHLLLSGGCGGPDRASLEEDVRLEVSHEPPGSAPAGEPVLLGIRLSSTPPLAPGSAHLWFDAEGEWVRLPLEPLPGTERLEAELPAQPRGRIIQYYFTVQSPLGKTVRLPERRAPDPAQASVYTLVARAPVAAWAGWLRAAGAALALVLLAGGTLVLSGRAGSEKARGRTAAAALAIAGLIVFAAALVGALAASYQATGNPMREVPGAWWIAVPLWLLAVLLGRRGSGGPPGAPPRSRARLVLARVLGLVGAVAVLVGLASLL